MSSSNIKDLILYPNVFNLAYLSSLELWNKGNALTTANSNAIHKTIYSPSSSSYKEVVPVAFTGFTTNGAFNNGWNFYCNPNSTGSTIYFATLGIRIGNVVSYNGGSGHYWTAGPSGSNSSYTIGFNTTTLYLCTTRDSCWGMTMQSSLESYLF